MSVAIQKAILTHFRSVLPDERLRKDVPGYFESASDNLLSGIIEPTVLNDFIAGDGGELTGTLPKFCAVHSSSALAANAFGAFRFHPERLSIAGLSGFTDVSFEKKLPTGLGGRSPNLDVVASGLEGVVAVESKFTEMFQQKRKKARFAASYDRAIGSLAEPAWAAVYRSLIKDPLRFPRLDVAQLVKHYLGIRHTLRDDRRKVLVYAYWEPTNAEAYSPCIEHRAQVRAFQDEVADSEVAFVPMSYTELWDRWIEEQAWEGSVGHVDALRRRYHLAVE